MCFAYPLTGQGSARPPNPAAEPGTCFAAKKLNETTFLVIEEDKWNENPFIYVKSYPTSLVLIDTGSGGISRHQNIKVSSLKIFLETHPLAANNNEPLNPGATKSYVVICSHCHFDHIGGVPLFAADTTAIWASGYDKEFIEGPGRLPTTSMSRYVGMETPEYKVTHWGEDGEEITDSRGNALGLVLYQTPGHTPDELAVWDPSERVLFVGDTLYEDYPILFPPEGCIISFRETLQKLRCLVDEWNSPAGLASTDASRSRVKLAAGHLTFEGDAGNLIAAAESFLVRVADGTIKPEDGGPDLYGMTQPRDGSLVVVETLEVYKEDGNRISYLGPRSLFDKLRHAALTEEGEKN